MNLSNLFPADFKSSFIAAPEHWWNIYHRRNALCGCKQLCKFEGVYPVYVLLYIHMILGLDRLSCTIKYSAENSNEVGQ